MKNEQLRATASALLVAMAAMLMSPAWAAPLALSPNLIFDGAPFSDDVAAPRLGRDHVVFKIFPIGPFGAGPGIIAAQQLNPFGAPVGAAVTVSRGVSDDSSPDVADDYVVYAADNDGGVADAVRLYDLTTGSDFLVANRSAAPEGIGDVRIGGLSGERIAWSDGTVVLFQEVGLIGTGNPPLVVRGPVPNSKLPEIDRRFLVWQERAGPGFDLEARAQELGGSSFFVTPNDLTDGFDEIDPTTWGDLIAFGLVDTGTGLADVVLRDVLANTTQTFALGLQGLNGLSLSEDYLAFNALDDNDVEQAFLMRLDDAFLLQLTEGGTGGAVGDVRGNLVAYTSGRKLLVAEISEVPLPPALALLGFGLAGLVRMVRRP